MAPSCIIKPRTFVMMRVSLMRPASSLSMTTPQRRMASAGSRWRLDDVALDTSVAEPAFVGIVARDRIGGAVALADQLELAESLKASKEAKK